MKSRKIHGESEFDARSFAFVSLHNDKNWMCSKVHSLFDDFIFFNLTINHFRFKSKHLFTPHQTENKIIILSVQVHGLVFCFFGVDC